MTYLLDGNVFIALVLESHAFHRRANLRKATVASDTLATCCITEGTLLRILMQQAADPSASAAWAVLAAIHAHPQHEFWPESFGYMEVPHQHLTKHAKIRDTWLVELARRKGAKLATLDLELSVLWPEVVVFVPVMLP